MTRLTVADYDSALTLFASFSSPGLPVAGRSSTSRLVTVLSAEGRRGGNNMQRAGWHNINRKIFL